MSFNKMDTEEPLWLHCNCREHSYPEQLTASSVAGSVGASPGGCTSVSPENANTLSELNCYDEKEGNTLCPMRLYAVPRLCLSFSSLMRSATQNGH